MTVREMICEFAKTAPVRIKDNIEDMILEQVYESNCIWCLISPDKECSCGATKPFFARCKYPDDIGQCKSIEKPDAVFRVEGITLHNDGALSFGAGRTNLNETKKLYLAMKNFFEEEQA